MHDQFMVDRLMLAQFLGLVRRSLLAGSAAYAWPASQPANQPGNGIRGMTHDEKRFARFRNRRVPVTRARKALLMKRKTK